jgi:sugar phosphate isomerase/epimerase
VAGQSYNPVVFEHAYAAISMIQSFAGVPVLIETLPNEIATFERILEFEAVAQIPNIGICYDTGHGEIGDNAGAIHLNDNQLEEDDHLWPFEGKRNWPALIEQIVLRGFEGRLILEARDDRLAIAAAGRSRLRDLFEEAQDSIDEFRLKYKLPEPRQKEEE